MTQPILHHYPQSPVTEKVRVVLGMKSLHWHSVIIPRLPPKPDLMPLTGGYRRTPVMQIGADIYCDSQCIIREIDRRFPEPTLFPGNTAGLAWGISRWTDGPLFINTIAVVLGAAEDLPEDFAADRGRLYFGPDFELSKLQQGVLDNVVQLQAQLGWIEANLAGDEEYLSGPAPGLIDALAYYLVWFIRGRWAAGPEFLAGFPSLVQWEQRIRDIGHGQAEEMEAAQALSIARNSQPSDATEDDHVDPGGLCRGESVLISPIGEGGDPEVAGDIHHIGPDQVSIARHDEQAGDVVVHFPRTGYQIRSTGNH